MFMENEDVLLKAQVGDCPAHCIQPIFQLSRVLSSSTQKRRVQYILNMNIFQLFRFHRAKKNAFRTECRGMEKKKTVG